ncbi:SH3 domain-containing kinase-binding protein 1 isoform X2 [Kryptolebias marmoratus]|uniref:SH3 domain-containing kinase-binding protein 1 isoform X2 n=1 Tax=Kryptolebias marmoratus TaxID=37003 RepID=UPI0007F9280A|nr:SH3 domain-containing kinase-binding protein 1 isoform X2 [Kryptolebias marmoratus]
MMGNYSSALIPDTEEFESIVSVTEKVKEHGARAGDENLQSELQTLVTLMIEEEKKEREAMNSSTHQESTQGASQNPSAFQVLSAVLHPAVSSDPRPGSPEENSKANLEQLQAELRDLRDQFEQMKSQHNKEIKLLMSELDEEKRIRLTLQMEMQRMKKRLSK